MAHLAKLNRICPLQFYNTTGLHHGIFRRMGAVRLVTGSVSKPPVVSDDTEEDREGTTLHANLYDNKVNTDTSDLEREIPVKRHSENMEKSNRKFSSNQDEDSEIPNEDETANSTPFYETHIPTNAFQKMILSVGSSAVALVNPWRHDMVAVFGETTGYSALAKLYAQMVQDPEGKEILKDKPRINSSSVDLEYLAKLPEGSLGHAYVKFLVDNNVTPDSRLPVQFVDDHELAYVMQRYREVHDLFHTILGMPTNMLGEVAVKWVEALQIGLPMCTTAALFGPLRFRPKQREKYLSTYLPWAVHTGRSSKLLMNIYFEKRWEQSLAELQKDLGIETLQKS